MADAVIREGSFVFEHAIAEAQSLVFGMDAALRRVDERFELGDAGGGRDSNGRGCGVSGVFHEDLHGE